jgi:hypothetical protein
MTRRLDSKTVLTVVVLLGVLALALLRANQWRAPTFWTARIPLGSKRAASSPEDGIYAMLDAARAGNTAAYLDCFAGPLREQLAATAKEDSEAKFKTYLLGQNSAVQGFALSVTDRPSADQARVRLEYIFLDHNEVQNVELRREGARWRITSVDTAQPVRSPTPYGAKATD